MPKCVLVVRPDTEFVLMRLGLTIEIINHTNDTTQMSIINTVAITNMTVSHSGNVNTSIQVKAFNIYK